MSELSALDQGQGWCSSLGLSANSSQEAFLGQYWWNFAPIFAIIKKNVANRVSTN